MTKKLSDQDWEMLSAYMDGRISSTEKSLVDQRFESDPEWTSAYQSLVKTRIILRESPGLKRRRNYYLTSEMVRKSNWLRIIPTLNFSSVAAAVLAVFLFMLDVFPQASVMNRAMVPPAAQDSAARPAAEAYGPGKSEFNSTLLPESNAEPPQADGIAQNQEPLKTPTSGVIRFSTIPPAAASAAAAAPAPAPEEPQAFTLPAQPNLEQEGLTAPSMKAAPSQSLAVPSVAQDGQAPQVENSPVFAPTFEATNQLETQPMEKALLATSGPVEELLIEPSEQITQDRVGSLQLTHEPVNTPIPTTLSEQKATDVLNNEITTETAQLASPIGGGLMPGTPTVITGEPVGRTEPLPISRKESFVKIGWIFLLFISGTLALLSAILKKKSLS